MGYYQPMPATVSDDFTLLAPLNATPQRSRRIRLTPIVAAALVAIFLLIPFSHGFKTPAAPMDEGALLLYPELILKGQLPYRDFETFYGPGNLYALAGTYKLLGCNISVE